MNSELKTIQYISVNNLLFDPQNPRLPRSIDASDERAVINWMLKDATIPELMNSIGQQGYFSGEPLLVVPTGNATHIVVEGNRRLTAVKLLHNPEKANIKSVSVNAAVKESLHIPDSLPVLVFENRNQILDYLGYRHITGIKQWSSLAKAKYLQQLSETLQDKDVESKHRKLAKMIGSRTDYVTRLLSGLVIYEVIENERFFNIKDLDEDEISFSVLTTALNYSNIAKFINIPAKTDFDPSKVNKRHLEEVTRWIFEKQSTTGRTVIGESRNLRMLSDVVAEERAVQALRETRSLESAHLLTKAPQESFSALLTQSKATLLSAQSQLHLIREVTTGDQEIIREIGELVRNLRLLIAQRLDDQD